MRLSSPWVPRLAEGDGPLLDRLVAALVDDIATGAVEVGARLPAHRDLAWRLGVGVGTVTRAYGLLERRGLVRSERGRGMFVTGGGGGGRRAWIDLSVNTPPQTLTDRLLAATFAALARDLDAANFSRYRPAIGALEDRRTIARWLADQRVEVPAERLLLTNGAQHALAVAFAVVSGPGGRLFTEAATYPGALTAAVTGGIALTGVAIDDEGMRPDALDAALAATSGASGRAVYVTPTLHNPTTATMGAGRRRDLVAVARAHDVAVVEDDVYSLFTPPGLSTLAELAPERVVYVNGFSKTLNPGLRLGFVAPPAGVLERTIRTLQATQSMTSPFASAMVERWILDGTARSIADSIRREAAARVGLARAALSGLVAPASDPGFHVWLPLPPTVAERTARAAALEGVAMTPPEDVAVDPALAPTGFRLCLGGPSREDLVEALAVVARARAASEETHGRARV